MALQHCINKRVIDHFALAVCFDMPAMQPCYAFGCSAHSPASHLEILLVLTVDHSRYKNEAVLFCYAGLHLILSQLNEKGPGAHR